MERLGEVIGVLREQTDSAPTDVDGPDLAALTAAASASGLVVESHVDGEAGRSATDGRAGHAPGRAGSADQRGQTRARRDGDHLRDAYGDRDDDRGGERSATGAAGVQPRPTAASVVWSASPNECGWSAALSSTARATEASSSPRGSHGPRTTAGDPVIDRALPREHRRARRRLGRSLVVAVMVPLVTGALLSGALAGWETLSASQAVLDPGDYARLRIGQDRSEVERVLPRRQTRHRPLTAEPTEDGTTCEYYAMTADRFDDRSGDAYRLCFRDDVLVSRDTVTP